MGYSLEGKSDANDAGIVTVVDPGGDQIQIVSPSTSAATAAWAEKGVRVLIGPTDPISNLPVTIPYDHHQIHEGETWHWYFAWDNLASASSLDLVFTVPNITISSGSSAVTLCPHFRYEVETNDLATVIFYEGPTVTGGTGTARTPLNHERNGTYTPKLTILEAPTVTNVGTEIDRERFLATAVGLSAGGGVGGSVEEWVLKNNTKYLFRITSGNNGMDGFAKFMWYEDLGV